MTRGQLTKSTSCASSETRRGSPDEGSGHKEGAEPRKGGGLPGNVFLMHHPTFVDKWVAEKQAHWLEKVLAEEHERDRKHPDQIELPD